MHIFHRQDTTELQALQPLHRHRLLDFEKKKSGSVKKSVINALILTEFSAAKLDFCSTLNENNGNNNANNNLFFSCLRDIMCKT